MDIYIIGQINETSYEKFSRELDELCRKKRVADVPIRVELVSEGGNAADGLAFYGKIRSCKYPIHITAHGIVQSAATLVLAAADYRSASVECVIMVHDSTEKTSGNVAHMQRTADRMLDEENQWATLFAHRTSTPKEFWRQLSRAETYMSAEQALQYGLINQILRGKKP